MPPVIKIPQALPNEDRYCLVDLHVKENDLVKKGKLLGIIETTKSTVELHSEESGYIRKLNFKIDDQVNAGDILCYITQELNSPLPNENRRSSTTLPIKATNKALRLIEQERISMDLLPKDRIIQEKDVMEILNRRLVKKRTTPKKFQSNSVVFIGAGDHALVCRDLLAQSGEFELAGCVIPADHGVSKASDFDILGTDGDLGELKKAGIHHAVICVAAISDPAFREKIYLKIKKIGFKFPNLIHPSSVVEKSAILGEGVQIMAKAVVASGARIANNVLVNTGAIVSHGCVIGGHCHIAPGAILGGNVKVGERSMIGMGASIYLGLAIGSDVVIQNGVHIFTNIPEKTIVKSNQSGF